MLIRKRPLRFSLVFLFLILCLVYFGIKLVLIQVFRSSYLSRLAEKQHNYFIQLEPNRGTIYDRHMKPLAINVAAYSLYAQPKIMQREDKNKTIRN